MHNQPKHPCNVFWTPQATVSMHELPPKFWKTIAYCKKTGKLGVHTVHEVWPHSMGSHTSHGVSGSPPEELKHCLLLWFAHRAIPELHRAPPATLPGCTSSTPQQHFEIIAQVEATHQDIRQLILSHAYSSLVKVVRY